MSSIEYIVNDIRNFVYYSLLAAEILRSPCCFAVLFLPGRMRNVYFGVE